MAVAVFNLAQFLGLYPEFSAVSTANPLRLPALFQQAGLYLSNDDSSPVRNLCRRGALLNMLTAHQSFLAGDLSADGQARPVGRMSQAAEGSVSASFDYTAATDNNGAWFKQTPYGADFWQATSSLRAMRYIGPPRRYRGNGNFTDERC